MEVASQRGSGLKRVAFAIALLTLFGTVALIILTSLRRVDCKASATSSPAHASLLGNASAGGFQQVQGPFEPELPGIPLYERDLGVIALSREMQSWWLHWHVRQNPHGDFVSGYCGAHPTGSMVLHLNVCGRLCAPLLGEISGRVQ